MKRNKLIAISFVMIFGLLAACSDLEMKSAKSSFFLKYFGGVGSQTGVDFVVNADGTFVMFGTSKQNNGPTKFYLAKSDAQGNVLWEKVFPAGDSSNCQARDIELAKDGSIIIVGNITLPGRADHDIYIANFQQDNILINENVINYNQIGTTTPLDDNAASISVTKNGYIIAGSTAGNITVSPGLIIVTSPLLLRLNQSDLKLYNQSTWPIDQSYSQGQNSFSAKVVQQRDSFLVFGHTDFVDGVNTPNLFHLWYFSIKSDGTPATKVGYYSSSGLADLKMYSVTMDTANNGRGIFFAGIQSDVSGDNLYFGRLKPPQELQFKGTLDYALFSPKSGITLGGVSSPPYSGTARVSTALAEGGFLVLTNEVTSGNSNMILLKILDNGDDNAFTPAIYGGQGDDFAGAVQELPDGRIVIVGTITLGLATGQNSETKLVLMKVNKEGKLAD